MLGLSMTEVIIILGLALILLGPDQLPSIAKTIGKGMREIRKATDDLKSTFDQEMVRMDDMVNVNEQPRSLQPVGPATPTGQSTPPADPAAARAA
ncbi:MAG: twin-arginine translocase TatA/TatE family subunit, partial [Myxococcales bacterium]